MGAMKRASGEQEDERLPPKSWAWSYVHGAASSLLATLATFPVYKTVFRQQLHGVLVWEAVGQLQREGLRKFYRGVGPPLLAKTVQGTLLFGNYNTLLRQLSETVCTPAQASPGSYSLPLRTLAGLGSGALEALVLTPFERVQNVLQDGRKDRQLPTLRSILHQFNRYNLANGYYRALLPIVARNSLGSALYFGFKDPIRDGLGQRGVPVGVSSFASGAMNGMVVSLLLYPLNVLIANMQAQVGPELGGTGHCLSALWVSRQRRVGLLYRGGSLVVLRSCLTWGLTNAIYDRLTRHSHTHTGVDGQTD